MKNKRLGVNKISNSKIKGKKVKLFISNFILQVNAFDGSNKDLIRVSAIRGRAIGRSSWIEF